MDARESRRARIARWTKELFRKERKEQFDREVQLTMVWLGHGLIVLGVAAILILLFGDESVDARIDLFWGWKPAAIYVFWAIEGAIVGLSFLASSTKLTPTVEFLKGWLSSVDRLEKWIERHGDGVRGRMQASILLLVYSLQLGSMVTLLLATGGPIDSPFAPMTLAIAVFAPFIVNKWWTVGLIVLSTMVFYAVFVGIAGFDKEPTRPEPGAYIAVNLFILLLASLMTWKRREKTVFILKRTFDAPRERVWKAWTDEGEVQRWFGSSNGSAVSMDVRSQGKWKAALMRKNGSPGFPWTGVYREVDEPKRLVFTIAGRAGRGEEVVEVKLEEKDGKTAMTVRLKDDGRHLGLKDGWSSFFDRMEQFLVEDPPAPQR